MIMDFSKILNKIKVAANDDLEGYSSEEISKIEKLYEIIVDKDFKSFLELAGKCSGGVIGDQNILLYQSGIDLRTFFFLHAKIRDSLGEFGLFDIAATKPFFFAKDSESLFYFVKTTDEDNQKVYSYDRDNGVVEETGWNFASYIEKQISETKRIAESRGYSAVCRGDILYF